MSDFTKKQMKILRGNYGTIANDLGCSLQYVILVIKGKRPCNTELAHKIIEKANSLLKVFEA